MSLSVHATQAARILRLLLDADGAWIPSPELAKISLQYSARVRELRVLGHEIENKVVVTRHGGKRGFFRIQSEAMRRAMAALIPKPAEPAKPDDMLFDLKDTHRDDN